MGMTGGSGGSMSMATGSMGVTGRRSGRMGRSVRMGMAGRGFLGARRGSYLARGMVGAAAA